MLSKLWATHEMNFWEHKIHRALECNFDVSDSTVKTWSEVRRDTNHSSNKCFSQNKFNLGNLKSHSHT